MIRVLLADDEPVILRGVKKLVPWQQLGLEIVGEVTNGLDLINAVQEKLPQIIISDICMPGLSGVDVIKKIRQLNIDTKVIFISGFQEFKYAREAMKYGAIDYLVKPIDKTELEKVILNTVSLITKENLDVQLKDKLEQFEEQKQNETMKDLLESLIEEISPLDEIEVLKSLNLKGPLFSVAILEIDRIHKINNSWNENERKLAEFSIENILYEILDDEKKGYYCKKNNQFILLVQHEKDLVLDWMVNLQSKINQFSELEVSVGVGNSVSKIRDVSNSYQQANQALSTKFFLGLNHVIPFKEVLVEPITDQELYQYQEHILECFITADVDKLESILKEYLAKIKSTFSGNKSVALSTCYSNLVFVMNELKKYEIHVKEWGVNIQKFQSSMYEYTVFDEFQMAFVDNVLGLYRQVIEKNRNKETLQLIRVKNHIEEHYSEDIKLETVADLTFMNPYYFSSFFKKHTKQNFKNYLTEIRMKHAVRLLLQTDLLVYEIAEKVGYNNPRQFSTMFKKMYGQLPNDYKQSKRSKIT